MICFISTFHEKDEEEEEEEGKKEKRNKEEEERKKDEISNEMFSLVLNFFRGSELFKTDEVKQRKKERKKIILI